MGRSGASQPDFRLLFESLPGLFVVVEPDAPRWTIVAVSDAFTRATRTKREAIVGRGLTEVFPVRPGDPTTDGMRDQAASLETVRRTRAPDRRAVQRYDVRRPSEEGGALEERWWSPINCPVLGRDGALEYIVCRVEDVTELVRLRRDGAEQHRIKSELRRRLYEMESEVLLRGRELEEANRRLLVANEEISRLVDEAPDGVFVADLAGRYTSVNGTACHMLGYTREELIGKTIVDLIPTEDVERLSRSRADLLRGAVEVAEWRLRRKDGSYLPVEVSAKILPDGRWQAFVRDITKRRHLERALQASHADLERAQSVAKIGSWRLDVQKNVLTWTDENYRIFGIPRGTPMTYEAFLAVVHPDDRPYVDREWNAALGGAPYDIEHRLLVDGEVKWVREKADLQFDEHGRLLGGVGITQDVTERRRLEEAQARAQALVRVEQERLDLALKGAGLASWDWDVRTGTVVFNDRWAELRGYRLDEIRPHVDSWTAGVHPDDMPQVRKALADHFAGLTDDYRAEHRVRTRTGAWIWILDVGKVFTRDEQGHPLRMVGVELDITERRRLEDELRLAEAKSSGIVSISADAIISIDEEQKITLFNEGAERIFGWSKAEAIGAPLDMLIPERFRATHGEHVRRFAAAPDVSRRMGERGAEISGLRKNGEEFPADAALSKLEIQGRKILTVALRDVTEQKRIERAQRLLADVGAAVVSTLDYEQTVANIARIAVRELADHCIVDLVEEGELHRFEIVSRDPAAASFRERLTGLHLERARRHLTQRVLETRAPLVLERVTPELLDWLSADEEHLSALRAVDPRSIVGVPLLVHGTIVGAMLFISTSPSRTYRREDVRILEELAQRAALAIENARLYREARRAVRARDEVLGIVAHDLRNPLGTILLNAALLQRGPSEPGTSRASVAAIQRAAVRMDRLIQDLLDVARVEAGRLVIEPRETPTAPLLADALESQRARAASAGLRLESQKAEDLPAVWADRDRLLQVFENLVGNATKFTPRGGVVSIGATPRDGEVLFWVSDTGVGISPDELPHVFARFWQARRVGRRGAGLGLAIVKAIVEEHGGRAWVESEVGRGSTFFFTVPTAAARARVGHREAHPRA